MIDTSVWIECRTDEELRKLIEAIANKNELRSSEVIVKELDDAADFLRKKKEKNSTLPRELHNMFKKAVVKTTNSVLELANEYISEAKKLHIPTKKKLADFSIVAAATLDNVDFILTLNRKTLASEIMRTVYTLVNDRRKLKTPQILTDRLAIRGFFYV